MANIKWEDYENRICPDDSFPLRVHRNDNSVGKNLISGYSCTCGRVWEVIAWNVCDEPGMLRHVS